MKMMKKSASKRFAALVVLGAMLFALAAPQASAADQTANEMESYTIIGSSDYVDTVSVTETVTYQIGGKTIKLEQTVTEPPYGEDGRIDSIEWVDTYTLSKPLKAIERKDDGTVIWSVPANTTITCVRQETQKQNGEVIWKGENTYIGGIIASRYFSAAELESVEFDTAIVEGRIKLVSEEDKGITIQKGKMYQLADCGPDGWFALRGHFVFLGV